MRNINETIGRFYKLIEGKEGGEPDSRYKSWEWCHQFFMKYKGTKRDEISDEIIDQMALHLAFYLASWGMYRGSSFLLQRDYKVHKKAVDVILKEKYEPLWDYSPDENSIKNAAKLIFDKDGAYWELKKAYSHDESEGDGESVDGDGSGSDIPSDTLITKILMGTFGCIPAFDRFLKRGISQTFPRGNNTGGKYKITQSIDNESSGSGKETFLGLSDYVLNNRDAFKIGNKLYPPMKCLDMYLWELGYEYELWDVLRYAEGKKKKVEAAREKAKKLGFGENTDDPKKIAEEIREKNGF